jgi:hypothetical protein
MQENFCLINFLTLYYILSFCVKILLNCVISFLYMRVLEIIFGIYIYIYFRFFCVKRPNGVSGRPDGAVVLSERSFSLLGWAC